VVDARRILSADGLVKGAQTPYLDAALRRLDDASNWKDVRTRLAEIHEIAHHDLPIIPLWQTENYFAYRTTLSGIGESPVVLYQNVDEWTTIPAGSLARSRDGN
jgi:ABC-type oligopeptide transport system substrate-binding subunit